MGLFGNVSKRVRETVDETLAQKKAEAAARKKLSEIETTKKINTKAKSYTRKGLSIDEARVLAKADIGKEKAADRSKKIGDSMKGLESSLGSSMGSMNGLGSMPDMPKTKKTRKKNSKASPRKSITINIGESKETTRKNQKKKSSSNEPDYMSVFRN